MVTRKSSRAIIINRNHEIFLFKYNFDYLSYGKAIWITPGGGLEDGESFDEALKRELYEELGIQLNQYHKQIYYRNPIYTLENGETVQCEERFYLIYLDGIEFTYTNWTDTEQKRMLLGKWWSLNEIKESKDEFFSSDIIHIINDLSKGKIPNEPIEIT